MTTMINLAEVNAPVLFEVFFFANTEGGDLTTRLFAKANADYHRMFDFRGTVVHVAVRLGAFVYEVTTEGVDKYEWTEELLQNERLIGFYTVDISNISLGKRIAAHFTLDNLLGRKLDVGGCLRYLWQSVGLGKSEAQLSRIGYTARQDLNLPPATFTKDGRNYSFHLPFTCATLVNVVLYHLFEFEPGFYGHLAQSSALTLAILAEAGFGAIYDLATDEWVAGEYYDG